VSPRRRARKRDRGTIDVTTVLIIVILVLLIFYIANRI